MVTSTAPNKTYCENTDALNINTIHRVIIISLTDPDIKKLIKPFGYSERKLLDGKKLYKSVRNMQNTLNIVQRWQRKAKERLGEARTAAHLAIHDLMQAAGTAAGVRGFTDISGADMESLSVSVFLARAYAVFKSVENIPEEYVRSIPIDALRRLERSKIITLDNANQVVEAAKTSVKKASVELAEATDDLIAWYAQYATIAEKALRGNKKLLNLLGLKSETDLRKPENDDNPQC